MRLGTAPAVSAPFALKEPDGGDVAIVIRQARWKAALLCAGSMAFVLVGAWAVRQPDGALVGWPSILFFGLGMLAGVAQLILGGRLTLSPAGLRLEHMGRNRFWAWDRTSDFRVWRSNRTQLVTFEDHDARPGLLQRLNAGLGAGSANLPPSWAIQPQALAELLEQCRARWS